MSTHGKGARVSWGLFALAAACSADGAHVGSTSQAALTSSDLVISQVYGAGGNNGATYNEDFVELTNIGASTLQMSDYAVQYAADTSNFDKTKAIALPSYSLAPGQYFLVGFATGNAGSPLPTPDATSTINMAAGAGKVAVVLTTDELDACGTTNTPCNASDWVDFAGYGTTAQQYEGSGAAPAPNTTNSDVRTSCTDTGDNKNDFAKVSVDPHNTASTFAACALDASVDAIVIDSPIVDAVTDAIIVLDGGAFDSGTIDSGVVDSGALDGGALDAGPVDAGPDDANADDANADDAGAEDSGIAADASPPSDGGIKLDAGSPKDASVSKDAATADAATGDEESASDSSGCSCTTAGDARSRASSGALAWLAALVVVARRRKRDL